MKIIILLVLLGGALWIYYRWSPIREHRKIPVYKGALIGRTSKIPHDTSKINVFLTASNDGTEIFDLMAPFYLFNLTKKANVYVVTPEKRPVALVRGVFILPHYTFAEMDALAWSADVLVIPNLSSMKKERQSGVVVEWIKKAYASRPKVLSVCAGSFTAASAGIFDGVPITSHPTDLPANKASFDKPVWVSDVTFTRSKGLYSTAGVSNAVEGTLAMIKDLFGDTVARRFMDAIHYPGNDLKVSHKSLAVSSSDKRSMIKKVLFSKGNNIGVRLHNNIDEFYLAAILDSYHRSFPKSLKTFSNNNLPVTTRFGLIAVPTGTDDQQNEVDEMHVVNDINSVSRKHERIVNYDPTFPKFIFDVCLDRIEKEYGTGAAVTLRRLLDYN